MFDTRFKERFTKWIREKIDYSKEKEGKLFTFKENVSFSDFQLPHMDSMTEAERCNYQQNVLHVNTTYLLEKSLSLNRFGQVIKLHAVNVPKDGNCLLHAVSVAVWGTQDSMKTLQALMFVSLKTDLRLKEKWYSQGRRHFEVANKIDSKNDEWSNILNTLSDVESKVSFAALRSRLADPFYVYILANILRRPIIVVTDSVESPPTVGGDIGGIYLPLEWEPIQCSKTPIIIGYSLKNFYPLLSETSTQNTYQNQEGNHSLVFPLVNSDLGFLLIRYLTKEEETKAWDLVQLYLLVKEIDFSDNGVILTKISCAKMNFKPINPLYNSIGHLNTPKEFFSNTLKGNTHDMSFAKETCPPYFGNEYTSPLHDRGTRDLQNENGNKFVACNQEQYPIQENVTEPGESFVSFGDQRLIPTAPFLSLDQSIPSEAMPIGYQAVTPTAPFLSLEPQSHTQMLSMMNERCKNKCGYRCSVKTYPFCHECHQIEMQKNKLEHNLMSYQRKELIKQTTPGQLSYVERKDKESTEDLTISSINGTANRETNVSKGKKCESRFCDFLIVGSEHICSKCQDILRHHKESLDNSEGKSQQTSKIYTDIHQFNCANKSVTASGKTKEKLYKISPEVKSFNSSSPEKNLLQEQFVTSLKELEFAKDHNSCPIKEYHKTNKVNPYKATSDKRNMCMEEGFPSHEKSSNTHYLTSVQESEPPKPLGSYISNNEYPCSSYSSLYQSLASTSPLASSEPASHVFSHPELNSQIVTSMTSFHRHPSSDPLFSTSFYSTKEEEANHSLEQGCSELNFWKQNASTCKLDNCLNYGNKANEGYCNSCYKTVRRQKILILEAHRGEDVPDSGMANVV